MAQIADRFLLSAAHRQVLLAHLQSCLPEEGCGLLAGAFSNGAGGQVVACSAVLPVTNELRSPVRFRMAPEDQLHAFYWIEAQGLELVGIFHSHPAGPSHPSATDLAEFAYPGVVYLIASPGPGGLGWQLNAFRIADGAFTTVEIEITDQPEMR